MAYERLLRKVNERKRKLQDEVEELNKAVEGNQEINLERLMQMTDLPLAKGLQTKKPRKGKAMTKAHFTEEDNIMDMEGKLLESSNNNATTISKCKGQMSANSQGHR